MQNVAKQNSTRYARRLKRMWGGGITIPGGTTASNIVSKLPGLQNKGGCVTKVPRQVKR